MKKDIYKNRLKEIFETTIESDLYYNDTVENINYYNMFCKAASQNQIYKIFNNDLCMFNYKYDNEDAILMIFYLPINENNYRSKKISEKIIEIIEIIEETFITVDYLRSNEIKEDKFIYVVSIKKI
jgi:hypothetical protein